MNKVQTNTTFNLYTENLYRVGFTLKNSTSSTEDWLINQFTIYHEGLHTNWTVYSEPQLRKDSWWNSS